MWTMGEDTDRGIVSGITHLVSARAKRRSNLFLLLLFGPHGEGGEEGGGI